MVKELSDSGRKSPLVAYKRSSLPSHQKGNRPDWLVMDRVLRAFELANEGRGRRAYVAWLEARAANEGGKIDEDAMKAIRRGWYLGKEPFRARLMKLIDQTLGKAASGRTRTGEPIRDHGEKEAAKLIRADSKELGLPGGAAALAKLPKSDERKVLLALILRKRTTVSNDWIASRLAMAHPGSVSRLISAGRFDQKMSERSHALDEIIDKDADSK